MAVVVRRAGAADSDLVSALNADVQMIHAAALPWQFKQPSSKTFPPSEAAALIMRPDHFFFIAEADGEPAGYAYAAVVHRSETMFHHALATLYLHHISVRPSHRRHGAGTALFAAVRALGKDLKVDLITADVFSFNEEARTFFRRQGLVPFMERLWDR